MKLGFLGFGSIASAVAQGCVADAHKVLPELIAALNTPGGLNRQFREQMESDGVFAAAKHGLDDLAQRLSG